MGYTKIITYGDNLELYEYEKDVVVLTGKISKRKRSSSADVPDIRANGESPLSERNSKATLGKRPNNAWRARLAFRRIVASNLGGSTRPLLVTLTHGENLTDLTEGYKHFSTFIQSLRHKFGKDFKYICVPEFQKRGSVHFHALVWGLPAEVFLLERKTRTLARLWGYGFVYLKETDGDERLSHYLAKYMVKAFLDPRLKNQKAYVASRNITRPVVIKGASPVWPILDEYNIDPTPLSDKTYTTERLGMGRHRHFKTHNDQH